jgi:hypothetical protein
MPRKHDAHKDELEGVAQRLRNERPQASPLDLDRIKTTAMSRAQAGTRRRAGARRLAVASLTVGLLAAGTGGVLAHGSSKSSGNAAITQYGNNCDNNNTTGNSNSDNCNENSFNTENITEINTTTNTITNTYNSSTVTVAASPTTATGAVQGTTTTKPAGKHPIKFHINVSKKSKLKKVTLKINGKIVSVLKGKKASANISIANLPCSANGTVVTVTAVTASGKTITETHTYHICS